MTGKTPYRIEPRTSYRFFQMNQQQKRVLKAALDEQRRIAELREATGEEHEELLKTLVDCGLEPDALALLHLVPLIQVAWADGEIQPREEQLLRAVAAARGIDTDAPAHAILDRWLRRPPADAVFDACDQVLVTMIEHLPEERRVTVLADLEDAIHHVAETAGGLFGFFGTVSAEEHALINRLVTQLRGDAGAGADPGETEDRG